MRETGRDRKPFLARGGEHPVTCFEATREDFFGEVEAPAPPATPDAVPSDTPEADLNIKAQQADEWTGVWTRSTLLGDMYGLRSYLGKYGVSLQATETSEYLGNVRGGLKTGGT